MASSFRVLSGSAKFCVRACPFSSRKMVGPSVAWASQSEISLKVAFDRGKSFLYLFNELDGIGGCENGFLKVGGRFAHDVLRYLLSFFRSMV